MSGAMLLDGGLNVVTRWSGGVVTDLEMEEVMEWRFGGRGEGAVWVYTVLRDEDAGGLLEMMGKDSLRSNSPVGMKVWCLQGLGSRPVRRFQVHLLVLLTLYVGYVCRKNESVKLREIYDEMRILVSRAEIMPCLECHTLCSQQSVIVSINTVSFMNELLLRS